MHFSSKKTGILVFFRLKLAQAVARPIASYWASYSQTPAATTVPHFVQFAGVVHDLSGKPMAGAIGINFALYAKQTGGAPLWLETQNVQADAKGNYSVELGAATVDGLPGEAFTSGQARWLGVQISGQPEPPRILLVAAPYEQEGQANPGPSTTTQDGRDT